MSGESKAGYEYWEEDERYTEEYSGAGSGPYYSPKDFHPVGTMPVLCGVCGREEFKVFSLSGQYSTWCECACGNKFEIHSG